MRDGDAIADAGRAELLTLQQNFQNRAFALPRELGRAFGYVVGMDFQAMPHMMSAQWDCLELIMESLSRDYPQHFTLERQGNRWVWTNRPLGIHQAFTFKYSIGFMR